MSLSTYHQKYTELSDEEIAKRAGVKEDELKSVFEKFVRSVAGRRNGYACFGQREL